MTDNILNFLYMGGYGLYVWSAYGLVIILLIIQWFIPWRRWQRYVNQQQNLTTHE